MEKENSLFQQPQEKLTPDLINQLKPLSNDKAFGIRDALLVKCRDTIENLNIDLDEEKRNKKQLQSQIKDLEHKNALNEHKLRSQDFTLNELKEQLEQAQQSEEIFKSEIKKLSSLKPLQEMQAHMMNTVKSLEHSLNTLQEENKKLKNQIELEKARFKDLETWENRDDDRIDLEKIELELEELYENKHRCMIKDFEKKQETLRDEMNRALNEIDIERQRYLDMYKATSDENNSLRQEIKYLQSMLQRKQNQLEKHSQQSLDQLQNILEIKASEQNEEFKKTIQELEKEKNLLESLKNTLQQENFRLNEKIEKLKKYEDLYQDYPALKNNIFDHEQNAKDKNKEKKDLSKNLEEINYVYLSKESEYRQDDLDFNIPESKYQALLQLEIEKRLKDKQSYKNNLMQYKEAFVKKIKIKDEKISRQDLEINELLCEIKYLNCKISEDLIVSDSRIINADAIRSVNKETKKLNLRN